MNVSAVVSSYFHIVPPSTPPHLLPSSNPPSLPLSALHLQLTDDTRASVSMGPHGCNLLSLTARHLDDFLPPYLPPSSSPSPPPSLYPPSSARRSAALAVLSSCDSADSVRVAALACGLMDRVVAAVADMAADEAADLAGQKGARGEVRQGAWERGEGIGAPTLAA